MICIDMQYFGRKEKYRSKKSIKSKASENMYGTTFEYQTNGKQNKIVQLQYTPTQDTIDKYEVIGIRAVPPEQEGYYKIGDILPESYDWDYEQDISTYYTTGETLGGSSCLFVRVKDDEPFETSLQKALMNTYEYEGKDIFIVGGKYVNDGQDNNEVIISDATAIGKIGIYKDRSEMPKLSELSIELAKSKESTVKEIKQNIEAIKTEDIKEKVKRISGKSKAELFGEFKNEMMAKYKASSWSVFGEMNSDERKKWKSLQ